MARTPRPNGWTGGSDDFGVIRTFDGHLGTNPYKGEDPASCGDIEARKNVKSGDEMWIGSVYGEGA